MLIKEFKNQAKTNMKSNQMMKNSAANNSKSIYYDQIMLKTTKFSL